MMSGKASPSKHDGHLDKVTQEIHVRWAEPPIPTGIIIHAFLYDVCLNAENALSLLAWLEQEKSALERLARDEE